MFPKPLLLMILATIVALPAGSKAHADEPSTTVTVTLDFGDGSQLRFTQLKHTDDMTVLDALEAASKHRRGVPFKSRGSGAIAFVSEIDGQQNEGASERNWIFKVNAELAKVSAGKQKLKPGDEVEWLFARYEDLR